jgi:hypothetical protein
LQGFDAKRILGAEETYCTADGIDHGYVSEATLVHKVKGVAERFEW